MKLVLLLAAAALLGACASPAGPTAPPRRHPPIIVPAAPTPNPGPSMLPPAKPGVPSEDTTPPPDGDCPPETLRGWSFYGANWPSGHCIGSGPCSAVNAGGGFPRGVDIHFDSTGHPLPGQAMPLGCRVPATSWSIAPHVAMRTSPAEPFAMQATFAVPGRYTVTSHGPEGVKAESGVVVIR